MITTNFEPLDKLLRLVESYLGQIPIYVFPAAIAALVFLAWFLKSGVKKEVKLNEAKTSTLPNASKYLVKETDVGIEGTESVKEYSPESQVHDGEDLEGRLVNALARAPWRVKEGSEIALEKTEAKKWRIATDKITFVLTGNEETPPSPPPLPPIPAEDKDEEEKAGAE